MRRILVLDPSNADPSIGNADEAIIVEVGEKATLDGKAIMAAVNSGVLVAHPVGKRVGKRAAETPAEPETPKAVAPKGPPPKAK